MFNLYKIFFKISRQFSRTFWGATCVISVCLSSYYIFQIYKKWDLSPVLIGFDSTPASIYNIPFPCEFLSNLGFTIRAIFQLYEV
jgi:amiloride-sensitive sodium channel